MGAGSIARWSQESGTPPGRTELAEALAALAPSELQRVLIGVHRRAAAGVEPATVLRRYREDRFAGPAGSESSAVLHVLATGLGVERLAAAWSVRSR